MERIKYFAVVDGVAAGYYVEDRFLHLETPTFRTRRAYLDRGEPELSVVEALYRDAKNGAVGCSYFGASGGEFTGVLSAACQDIRRDFAEMENRLRRFEQRIEQLASMITGLSEAISARRSDV